MHSAAFSVDVPEILPPRWSSRGDRNTLWNFVYFVVNFQHYKDTKLKSESQVFRDIFFKKYNLKGCFLKHKDQSMQSQKTMCFRVWSDGRVVSLFFAPLPEFESLSIYNYNIYYI